MSKELNLLNENESDDDHDMEEEEYFYTSATLQKVRSLSKHDKKFGQLEYQLKMSLHCVSVNILRIYALHTAEENAYFKQLCEGQNPVETFIDLHGLDENNNINAIVQRGFKIPENGMRITCGRIELSPPPIDASINGE